jgi:signal transduction histidine kinase
VEQAGGPLVDVALARPLPRLEPEVRLAVFRIVQEALWNSAKHARARQVKVALEIVDGRLEVGIHDDGRGFENPDADTDREGLGLSGMLDRAAHLGGDLRVESHPGEGTRVTLTIPILRREPSRAGRRESRLTTGAPKLHPERVDNVNNA